MKFFFTKHLALDYVTTMRLRVAKYKARATRRRIDRSKFEGDVLKILSTVQSDMQYMNDERQKNNNVVSELSVAVGFLMNKNQIMAQEVEVHRMLWVQVSSSNQHAKVIAEPCAISVVPTIFDSHEDFNK